MNVAERQARSALARLVTQRGVLRGSLSQRRRACGKPTCKYARGELHQSLYLVFSEGGKPRQLFVPKNWEALVRQWVKDYHDARRLLEEISSLYFEKVRRRQD